MKNTIRRTITRRGVIVASVLALGALTTIMALAFTDRATTGLPDPLPPMTLTYEVYGPSIGVGTRSIPAFKEIVRLDYRAQNDWRETGIESPELDLGRYGTASNVGSYVEVKGNTETDYDAKTDTFTTSTLDGGIYIPQNVFGASYTPIGSSPLAGTVTNEAVTTNVRVCATNGVCADNVAGIKYTKGDNELVVYQGDGFILPVENGDVFTLKSVQIHGQ